ncbi:heterokaryon incompatibility protein-domain-containing protein [Lophiotrema nucula]|uniref:Heterokaryon incompatibility protein-domain-containing protein n=1 Tax=Lophiotrema nucula TaxID=690887 RepID=A0A6A5YWP4_9PLEO|nr:heterokaryon incompatibility protein-domain-containing protein [Lophiotrema nucula]
MNTSIKDLTPHCVFCNVISQCYVKFVDNGSYSCYIQCKSNKLGTQLCFRERGFGLCDLIHVQLYSKGLNRPRNPFRSFKVRLDPTDPSLLSMMKRWVNDCSKSHEQCAHPGHGFTPTRLMHLAEGDMHYSRLSSPTCPVRFAALSYCWGTSAQSKTLKSNLLDRYDHLDISSLPRTLQDACFVTRALGLEYIWIDSLCIVQDDEHEWAEESSKMRDIYSSAHVVMAATFAQDCAEGFLSQRAAPLAIKFGQPDKIPFEVQARLNDSHQCPLKTYNTTYALFKRGWCMQERFLARRVVHFLPHELLFECQSSQICECGERPPPQDRHGLRGRKAFRTLFSTRSPDKLPGMRFGHLWSEVIHEYHSLKLTYTDDTLPALSGVARSVEHLGPGKYIAGLWERDIAYQLGWRLQKYEMYSSQVKHQPWHPVTPTFSWISCLNAVDFGAFPGLLWETRPICTLESSRVVLATADPHGRVRHASIYMRGLFIPGIELVLYVRQEHLSSYNSPRLRLDSGIELTSREPFEVEGQCEQLKSARPWTFAVCLGLYKSVYGNKDAKVTALLLASNADSNNYIRIGIIDGLPDSWFQDHASEGTFNIV